MSSTVVETVPVLLCKLRHDNGIHETCSSFFDCPPKGEVAQHPCGGVVKPPAPPPAVHCSAKNSEGFFIRFIIRVREPVADYLERHGLPKNARCSFVSLLTSLIQRAYAAGVTILMMLYNLFPLLDGFVYLIRFILDKILEIAQTRDLTEKILKGVLFLAELVVLVLLVMFIFGLIVMPVLSLTSYIMHKFIGVATSVG